MAIDYERLIEALSRAIDAARDDTVGPSAVSMLILAGQEATGASGATFTEYSSGGGRVVAATGAMEFALGQPVGVEFLSHPGREHPWPAAVDELPDRLAGPLAGRGIAALSGQPVQVRGATVGSVHLYFADAAAARGMEPVLTVIAAAIAALVHGAPPAPAAPASRDEDRTLFLAVAGHELRTPVTVIKGYASMLADRWDALDERSRRDAARVLMQRSDELARLVDRMLGASAGDRAAGWFVRSVPFDPVGALRDAVEVLPAELRRTVRLDVPHHLPSAIGDPAILTAIVSELVTNASRSNAAAEVAGEPNTIEIVARADADTVLVQVCDRGVGIHPGDAEHAFERFWRARRDGDGPGVGLGLFLVRRLVERQGGWVSLRPRDGGGAIAEVRFRRAEVPYPTAPSREG